MAAETPLWMLVPDEWMWPGDTAYALGMTAKELERRVDRDELLTVYRAPAGQRRYQRVEVAVIYWLLRSQAEKEAAA